MDEGEDRKFTRQFAPSEFLRTLINLGAITMLNAMILQ